MKMKKLMALVLALTLVLALAACGQTSTPAEGGDTEEAVKSVEDALEAYIDKNGSAYGFSFTTAIENAFKDASIEIKDIPVDKTFYL